MRRPATRLLAAHFVLVALATALVLGFVYWRAGGVIDSEQREVVEAELRGLAHDYAQGGLAALAFSIERRLDGEQERDAVYLLTTPDGTRLVGNLASWPETVEPGGGWTTLVLYRTDDGRATTISGLSLKLGRGERLLVGRDVAARAAFDETLASALVFALLAITGLSLGAGWLLSRLILGRISEIGAAADAIMNQRGPGRGMAVAGKARGEGVPTDAPTSAPTGAAAGRARGAASDAAVMGSAVGALDRRIALSGAGDEFDRLATSLNAMLDRIAALVSDLRMVTDSLAHDIRSPLGRLCRHLETALDEGLSAEARAERIEAALGEAQQTLSIATGLLEISRIEAGLAVEQFEPVDLRGLARDVSELYSAAAEERGVSLRLDVGEGAQAGGVTVWGHPQLLAQALANLVDNAVKFAPEGTAVQVGVRMGEGGPVVAVADRGAGVPEDARMLVRRRFVQLDPSRGGQGTGLGLALVDAVVRLHGAVLSLSDNAPGLRAEIAFPPPTG
jgi:hypothetical protein